MYREAEMVATLVLLAASLERGAAGIGEEVAMLSSAKQAGDVLERVAKGGSNRNEYQRPSVV